MILIILKKIKSTIETEYSQNIESNIFAAPEQLHSNNYTYKVDLYSIGMIIHFIITGIMYNFDFEYLKNNYENGENISFKKEFPKCEPKYNFFLNIYRDCFEISPNKRPYISNLIDGFIISDNNEIKDIKKIVIPQIIREFQKYEFKLINSNYLEFEQSVDKSYLEYFIGYTYFFSEYISQDINKAIKYLTISANQNNPYAQYYLGEIST